MDAYIESPNQIIRLKKCVYKIGRSPACDIVTRCAFVSRVAGTLLYKRDCEEWLLIDGDCDDPLKQVKGSRNGIYVNDQRVIRSCYLDKKAFIYFSENFKLKFIDNAKRDPSKDTVEFFQKSLAY